jgi:hypothetical protein
VSPVKRMRALFITASWLAGPFQNGSSGWPTGTCVTRPMPFFSLGCLAKPLAAN